uniref:Uncharacterized protein n=1 Tax=Setaria digitata TaxID=48799 RepID=A0A915Q3I3_9BILA
MKEKNRSSAKSSIKEEAQLPRVDDELHAKTIFEPIGVEARPAKTKPKIRSKLKWKEGLDPKEKIEESRGSDTDSGQMRLSIKSKKGNNQEPAKETTNKKSKHSDAGGWEQPIFYIIIRKILEEILIWLIIVAILIFTRLREQFRTR